MAVIGILGMGTMGSAVAATYKAAGHRVLTDLAGRSETSVKRAEACGIEAADGLAALVAEAETIFSIVPPDTAYWVAEAVAAVSGGNSPVFVDANAVASPTVQRIAGVCQAAGLPFVDGGIVGFPPTGSERPRLYLSGERAGDLTSLDGQAFEHMVLEGGVGRASAFKMIYAGLTKGTNALLVNQLLAAERAGLLEAYLAELAYSQERMLAQAERVVPRMPADAGRWAPEMLEIAAQLDEFGLPDGFHKAAERIMLLLAASPFAKETRETVDPDRSLADTLKGV